MRNTILNRLTEIERKENVRILYAAESGSRAWGFASPDSDYDVRFIYVRRAEDYIRVLPLRDVIEWEISDTLDISGWDIQKAFRLLLKSNPTLFEWSNSPVVYQTTPEWESVKRIISSYFSSRNGVYHYLHMAQGNYREYLQAKQVKLKKYLYVIRPILACRWILRTGTPPPMEFDSLVQSDLDPALLPEIRALLQRKKKTSELGLVPRIDPLNDYIEAQLTELQDAAASLPEETRNSIDVLNRLLQSFAGMH